jgi:pyridine nucleotide-disulfide oxidoreductase family protein
MTHLVLAGGGHAHLFVLNELARRRPADLQVTLVTPHDRQLYSAMLPGWIAGHYALDDLAIPLPPLARAAGANLLIDRVTGIDAEARVVRTAGGQMLSYDLLSIAVGSEIPGTIEGAGRAVPVRPLENFAATWNALAPRLAEADHPRVTVIGAGAGGVEIALAIAYTMRSAGNDTQVQLVSGGALLPGHGERVRALVRAALVRKQVRLLDSIAMRIDSDHVDLREGASLPSDLTLLACGAVPAPWVGLAGLRLDDEGFIAVDRNLRSVSHPNVFAAGDIASIVGAPNPRSGVYAVRAGPLLADNLLRQLEGRSLRNARRRRTALYLLATGPQFAIASWNGLAWSGDWVWHWKDSIDRRFVGQFRKE